MGKVQRAKDIYRYSIDSPLKGTSMAIDIYREVAKIDDSSPKQMRQRRIAEQLLDKLKEPRSWKFYLKCAYRLSENQIWGMVGLALRPGVKHPNRYFVFLANREMDK